jgi:predicted DNA-binding transcriptional regulator YafY
MTGDLSPTARALSALELIQRTPGISAERLADSLGVSERAARRYVAILREADIPIVSARGPYGGYTIGRGVRPAPLLFTAAEALGLVMAVLDGHHSADDPADPAGTALGKILRVLPESVAGPAQTVRSGALPAPDRGAARPDAATAATLVQACSTHRCVRVTYRSEAGNEWQAEVDPWAVVVRHGRWYLLCHSRRADARRAYRVDRVRAVEVLDETFPPPPDIDPVAELEAHLAVGWEYEVEVVVEAPVADASAWLSPALGRLEPVDERSCRLVATTGNPYWYAEQLARVPVPYRIVGGPELRATARALAERMLAATGDVTSPRAR